jgi:DNA-directed RNA polymerase specialized sigma24 family protein
MEAQSFDRVERLLALLLLGQMKDASQRTKAVTLSVAGFSNVEIADLLQTTGTTVASMLYQARSGEKSSRRRKR